MKADNKIIISMMLTIISLLAGSVLAGNLTPPGAPAPTMKTMQEVYDRAQAAEPRTAISAATNITQAGSYYLTGNISGTITIQANNVSLDLMGFRVAPGSGSAITISNWYGENTLIHNGTLRPSSDNVALDARYSDYCRFEDLRIDGNNALCGIFARSRSLVRNCDVHGCNNYGIYVGDNTEVRDNRVAFGSQVGIRANANCRIEGNRVENNSGRGIYVPGAGTFLANNTVRNNSPDFDLHATTVHIPSHVELQQQISALQQQTTTLQQQLGDLKLHQGATGYATVTNGMVLIPAGSFQMGDAFDEGFSNERPVHTVTISAFYMDQYLVTKALWDHVRSFAATNGYSFDNPGSGKGASHPVHSINWFDCIKWANARSQRDGLRPVYYNEAGFSTVYKTGSGIPYPDWSANGYRLPTEAEWEKAARGGVEGRRFSWSIDNSISHKRANYNADTSSKYDLNDSNGYHPRFSYDNMTPYTSPVGLFAPNGYGLCDMIGNVWEWCWDFYDQSYYAVSPSFDPKGSGSSSHKIIRGGSWNTFGPFCRVTCRGYSTPNSLDNSPGFRLVRTAQ